MAESALRDMGVVGGDIAQEGLFEVLAGTEAAGGQHLADASVDAFDRAVGLRVCGLNQAVLAAVCGTDSVERALVRRLALAGGAKAVGEFLAVIGERLDDLEGRGGEETLAEAPSAGGGFLGEDRDVDPAGGTVDGGEEVTAAVLVRRNATTIAF